MKQPFGNRSEDIAVAGFEIPVHDNNVIGTKHFTG